MKLTELRQLRQRITLRCRTAALTLEETFGYIAERLRIAGANGEPIFSKEAIQAVHMYSQGIPRVVNLLCEHSLINAYVDHLRPVPAHLVEEVAREFQLDEIEPTAPRQACADWDSGERYSSIAPEPGRIAGTFAPVECCLVFDPRKETMSRIHEALKKAEQERAAIATAETEVAPFQTESAAAATMPDPKR